MVVQGLALSYSKNKRFVLIHFQPTLPPMLPENIKKPLIFFSVGISRFKWNIGWKWIK